MFSRFLEGADVTDNFSVTGRALHRDDYLIFNTSNRTLHYDVVGHGVGAAVTFAVLTEVSADRSEHTRDR